MCYKEEVQRKNAEKLQKKFDYENIPEFIQDFFMYIASRAARINYWSTIKNMLEWMINKGYINKQNISDVSYEDLKTLRPPKIILYFEYLKYEKGIALTTLRTKKNQLCSFWEYLKNEHYLEDNVIRLVKSEEFKPTKTNRKKWKRCRYSKTLMK